MRVIIRKERPHPGAQLRFTDVDGCRVTAFATNTPTGQLPDASTGTSVWLRDHADHHLGVLMSPTGPWALSKDNRRPR